MSKYKIGDIIQGNVTGIEKYGVFINIDSEYNGLIHISEITEEFVRDINDYVERGETINCEILTIDEKNLQMKLSIKNINYRIQKQNGKVRESERGFEPLKENLNVWINDKIKEIND